MSEKKIPHTVNQWQLDLIIDTFKTNGIEPRVEPVPREYSSILTGTLEQSFQLYVKDADYVMAHHLIETQLSASPEPSPPSTAIKSESTLTPSAKRIIMLSLMGILIFPVIFNWRATQEFMAWKQHSKSLKSTLILGLVVCLGWIGNTFPFLVLYSMLANIDELILM